MVAVGDIIGIAVSDVRVQNFLGNSSRDRVVETCEVGIRLGFCARSDQWYPDDQDLGETLSTRRI